VFGAFFGAHGAGYFLSDLGRPDFLFGGVVRERYRRVCGRISGSRFPVCGCVGRGLGVCGRGRRRGQGLSAVAVLPAGFPFRLPPQRPGRGLSVDGGFEGFCELVRSCASRSATRVFNAAFSASSSAIRASYISRIEFIWLCSARTIAIRSATPSSSIPQ